MPPSPPRLSLNLPALAIPPQPLVSAINTSSTTNTSAFSTNTQRQRLPTSKSSSRNHSRASSRNRSTVAGGLSEMAPVVVNEKLGVSVENGAGEAEVGVENYDYIVIGGGSGGSGTARRAAGWYGKKTLLVENGRSGGCCVNVGCVPKKMTWNFANISETLKDSQTYGYATPSSIPFSYSTFKAKRDARILKLNAAYESNWSKEGITLIHGTASFTSPHTISVVPTDGSAVKKFTAEHITIATGGHPIIPDEKDVPGAGLGITSEGFFEIEELPKKIAIVGAGYIAVEIAGMLNAVGTEVHLFIRGDTVLRTFDELIQQTITKRYEDVGVKIYKGFKGFQKVEKIDGDGIGKKLSLKFKEGREDLVVDELLWAIGRKPETESLSLKAAGVELGEKGYVSVDKYQKTSAEGVYALGDVTGQLELTPVAIAAGRHLATHLFGPVHLRPSSFLNYTNVPTVIFAHPEIGTVGLTSAQAAALYSASSSPPSPIKTYTTRFSNMFYDIFDASEKQKNPTVMKIICVGEEEKVVGLHLLGRGVEEMLQGFAVAVNLGVTKAQLGQTVAIHPTSAEEVVTMR